MLEDAHAVRGADSRIRNHGARAEEPDPSGEARFLVWGNGIPEKGERLLIEEALQLAVPLGGRNRLP